MNFAQRVVIEDFKPQSQVGSNFNFGKHLQVQDEINKNKVDIDYSEFKKTSRDRKMLKEVKLNYSVDPEKNRDDLLKSFIDSNIPNWNLTFIVK